MNDENKPHLTEQAINFIQEAAARGAAIANTLGHAYVLDPRLDYCGSNLLGGAGCSD